MITTKQLTESALDPKQLGFEEAVSKGKLYNPLSGKELLEFLIRHIRVMLLAATPSLPYDLIDEIAIVVRHEIERHPQLDTEVLAYPKADVSVEMKLGAENRTDPATATTTTLVNIAVTKHPQEEKRGFAVAVEIHSSIVWGDRPPLRLTSNLNLEDVPPDALRILHDMPVPIPQRKPGTGPSGEATVVDEPTPATEKQKAAVEKQFGAGKMQSPLTSKSKKEDK